MPTAEEVVAEFTKQLENDTSKLNRAVRRASRKGTNDAVESVDARPDGSVDTPTQPLDRDLAEILAAVQAIKVQGEAQAAVDNVLKFYASKGDSYLHQIVREVVVDVVGGGD